MEVKNSKKRWEQKAGPDGRKFFVDHKRKKTLWQLPPNCDQNEVVIVNGNFHFRWVRKTAPPSSGRSAGKPFYVDYWNLSTHWQPPSPQRRWDVIALFAFGCAGDVGSFQWGSPGSGLATDKEFSYKCVRNLGEMNVSFTERGLSFAPARLTVVAGKKKKGSRVGEKAQRIAFGLDRIHGAHDLGPLSTDNARKCRDVKAKLKAQGLSSSSAKAAAAAIEAKAKAVYHVQIDLRDGVKYIVILENKKHCERLVKCVRAGLRWFQGKSIDYMQVSGDGSSKTSASSLSNSNRSSSQSSHLMPGSRTSGGGGGARRAHSTGNVPGIAAGQSSMSNMAAGAAAGAAAGGIAAASQTSNIQRANSDAHVHQHAQYPQQQSRRSSGHSQHSQQGGHQSSQQGGPPAYQGQGQRSQNRHSQGQLHHSQGHQGQGHQQHYQTEQEAAEPSSPRMQVPVLCQPTHAVLQQEPSFIQAPMQMPMYYMPPQRQQQQQQTMPAYPVSPRGYPGAAYPGQQVPMYPQQQQEVPPAYGGVPQAGSVPLLYPQQQVPEQGPPPPYCPPEAEPEQPPHASGERLAQSYGSGDSLGSNCSQESLGIAPPPALSPCPSPPVSPVPSPRQQGPGHGRDPSSEKAVAASLAAAAAVGAAAMTHDKNSSSNSEDFSHSVEGGPETTPVVVVQACGGAEKGGELLPPPLAVAEESSEEGKCGRAWLEKVADVPFPPSLSDVRPVSSSGWRKFLAGSHHQRLDKDAKFAIEEFVNDTGQWKSLVTASQELQASLSEEISGAHLAPNYVVAWSLLDIYLTAKATQAKTSAAAKQYLEVLGEEFLRFSIREALSLDMDAEEGDSFKVKQSGIFLEVASFASPSGCQASKELQKKFLVIQANGSMTRGLVPGAVSVPLACLLDLPTSRVLVTARPFARIASDITPQQGKASSDLREALLRAANLPQESAALLNVTPDDVGLFHVSDTPELHPRHTLAIFGPPDSAARVRPELLQLLLNEELLTSAGHEPLVCPTIPQFTKFIVDVMIPAFLKVVSSWLEVLTSEFGFQILVFFLHAYGLNLRLLAVLRAGIPPDGRKIRRLFMTEMAARSLRNVIRKRLATTPEAQAAETIQGLIKAVCSGEEREWHLLLDELEVAFPGIGLPGNNDVNGKGEITVTLDAITPELLVRRTLQMVGGYASDELARWLASPMPPGASAAPGIISVAPLSRATVPRALLWTVINDNDTDCKAQLILTALLEYPLDDKAQDEFLDRASGSFGAKGLRSFASTSGAIKSDSLPPIGVRLVRSLSDVTGERVEEGISLAFDEEGEPCGDLESAAAYAFLTRFHSPCGVYALSEALARLLLAVGLAVAETADDSDSEEEEEPGGQESSVSEAAVAVYERALGFLFAALHELQSHMHTSELLLDIYANIIGILSCLPQSYPHKDYLLFSMAVYHLEAHDSVVSTTPGARPRSAGLHLFMTTLSQMHPTTFGVGAMAMWKLRAYQCLAALAKDKADLADCTAFDQVVDLCRSEGVDVSQIPLEMDMSRKEFFSSLTAERKGLRKHTLPTMMRLRIDCVTQLLGFYCKPWRRA